MREKSATNQSSIVVRSTDYYRRHQLLPMHVLSWLLVPLLQPPRQLSHRLSPPSQPSHLSQPFLPPRQSTTALNGLLHEFTSVDAGKARLDVFLASEFKQYSRSFLSDLCEKGRVTVNGKPQSKHFKVSKGDKVVVDVDVKQDTSTVTPEYIPLDILYEDDHIIAVNKPNGMVVRTHSPPSAHAGTFLIFSPFSPRCTRQWAAPTARL
jgi:ribosomal 50S subunit-recycling heat shock protein